MQAALLIRGKQRLRRKLRAGRVDLPCHVATRQIGPFPTYPPGFVCSQGRAAWVERERGRRCSVSEEAARQQRLKQSEAHHRWMKRNRIHDTSYGGSSDGYDEEGGGGGVYSPSTIAYHQSAAANALLYVGLGTAAIGAIIFFVGTGEKGFKTLELRLIGPTLVACGLLCCLVRILLCACPSTCVQNGRKRRKKQMEMETCCEQHRAVGAAIAGAAAAMLPRPPPAAVHQQNTCRRNSGEKNDPCLGGKKQVFITTTAPPGTSARSEQQLIIPTIAEPPPDTVELVPLDVSGTGRPPTASASPPSNRCLFSVEYELQSVSDDDDDDDDDCEGETVIEVELPKHSRTREPCNSVTVTEGGGVVPPVTVTVPVSSVTTDSVLSDCSAQLPRQHSGIVLSPSQLQTKQ